MLQRIIGHTIGALLCFVILVLFAPPVSTNLYAIASIAGALTSFFWPIVIAWWLVRRHKERQQNQIDEAVAKSMADQNK